MAWNLLPTEWLSPQTQPRPLHGSCMCTCLGTYCLNTELPLSTCSVHSPTPHLGLAVTVQYPAVLWGKQLLVDK